MDEFVINEPLVFELLAGENLYKNKGVLSGMIAIGDFGQAVQYTNMYDQIPIGFIRKDYKLGDIVTVYVSGSAIIQEEKCTTKSLSKRQVQRAASKLRSRATGCNCSKRGYINAINDFEDMIIKKLETTT